MRLRRPLYCTKSIGRRICVLKKTEILNVTHLSQIDGPICALAICTTTPIFRTISRTITSVESMRTVRAFLNEGRRKIYVFAAPFIITFILFFLFDRLLKQRAPSTLCLRRDCRSSGVRRHGTRRLKLVPTFSDNDETLSVADFNDRQRLPGRQFYLLPGVNKLPFNNDSIFDNNIIQSKDQPDGGEEIVRRNGAASARKL